MTALDGPALLRARLLPLLPDLAVQAEAYRVDTSGVDDEIRDLFKEQLGALAAALPLAVAASDWPTIRRHAHSLQGMGGTVGFPDLSVFGFELSAAAKAPDLARCGQLVEAMTSWIREYMYV
ncbi:MAG: Hpt domain-containing protein [bacterium]